MKYNVPLRINYEAAMKQAVIRRAQWRESWRISDAEDDFRKFIYYDELIKWILRRQK